MSTTPRSTLAELASGAVGTILCSWATRVRRDDLMTLQIDGTGGSAIAGLHRCWVQSGAQTPTIRRFNPDTDIGADYRGRWTEVAGARPITNPYRVGWENFLRHVVAGAPLTAIFPPASATCNWRKPASAAPRNKNGSHSMTSPANPTAFVTGASTGLGYAIACAWRARATISRSTDLDVGHVRRAVRDPAMQGPQGRAAQARPARRGRYRASVCRGGRGVRRHRSCWSTMPAAR